jgi:predicted RNA binding protein YcfA (HicA-like mRNA interferase family)
MAGEQRFAAVKKMLEAAGYKVARINGSHHCFTKPGHPIIVVPVHRGKVKPVYVRQIQKFLEEQ